MGESARVRFAVVLAAGEGTRMKSSRPKPLVRLCGKPMIAHILQALFAAGLDEAVVVIGFKSGSVRDSVNRFAPAGMRISFVEQTRQRGTGDALATALTALPDPLRYAGKEPPVVMVVPGDTPLLRAETVATMLDTHDATKSAVTVAYSDADDPTGYGRVIFGKGNAVAKIVEDKDATDEERESHLINAGFYALNLDFLAPALRRLSPKNAQAEYYLTDVIEILAKAGYGVAGFRLPDPIEAHGVNDRHQLAEAEQAMRERINASLLMRGVNLVDPSSIYIDSTVEIGQDTTIWPGSFLVGQTAIGKGAEIGPEVRISDSVVDDGARVVRSELEGCHVGREAVVGPYAVLKPGAKVPPETETGSFVVLE
ncbi:MAG: NTP transferase domain-containing protein [Actinomycetota bacterium]|nr:NTP transferase domain-containing protein [Actinomycetota bacterium]MDA8397868.1 NTP transferase domain-containing protein [Actinomycetota bacterium]